MNPFLEWAVPVDSKFPPLSRFVLECQNGIELYRRKPIKYSIVFSIHR